MKVGNVLKGILGSVAPTIATSIGGPFGGMAASFVLDKLGIKVEGDNPQAQLESVVTGATPDQLLLIKQADNDFKVKMKELGIKESELEVRDRESARQLAISQGVKPQVILSIVYTSGYFIVGFLFLSGTVTVVSGLQTEFTAMMAFLSAAQLQIMNFWFGSSSGSKEKTEKLVGN